MLNLVITFQLTLPEWGATSLYHKGIAGSLFQLTLPEWGATLQASIPRSTNRVSTHAPRVGSDLRNGKDTARPNRFNSRSPSGERLDGKRYSLSTAVFQLTLPEWGATYSAKIPLFIDTSKGISRTAIRESFLHR